MRVTIDDYAYVFVRLTTIKSLLMEKEDIQKLGSMNDLDALGNYVTRFFPTFNPEEKSIAEFEWMLWDTYFKILERILVASPDSTQHFLKTFLLKYEITNIRICIYGVIENTTYEDRYWQVYDRPSIILERNSMLKSLLKAKNFKDIYKAVKNTQYSKIIKKGLEIYQKTGKIFELEHQLDKFYSQKLVDSLKYYDSRIKFLAEKYIRQEIDFYNLNLMSRAIYNGIGFNSIQKYLINYGYLFDQGTFKKFQYLQNFSDFIEALTKILKDSNKKEYFFIIQHLKQPDPEIWDNMRQKFLNTFLSRFQRLIIQDIPNSSLSLLFQILLYKQYEIKEIVKRSIQIAMASEDY